MKTTEEAILQRKTTKLMSTQDLPVVEMSDTLESVLRLAGMAPFHRACDPGHRGPGQMQGIEPWRFHVLDAANCRRLQHRLPLENAGKIPAMLAAADAMILATWLPDPQPAESVGLFAPTLNNMEHIAAAAAAIQNLLLAATSLGISNYWSSGGVLREATVFELAGIPQGQILLGAVFLFPSPSGEAQAVGSKLREHRSPMAGWSRTVFLDSP